MFEMEEEAAVGTVTVKLPAFLANKPEAWFAQAEANFRAKAPLEKELVAGNGTRIRCYGKKKLQLNVGTRTYEWTFLVADMKRSLIGADFLTHSSLLVDLRLS